MAYDTTSNTMEYSSLFAIYRCILLLSMNFLSSSFKSFEIEVDKHSWVGAAEEPKFWAYSICSVCTRYEVQFYYEHDIYFSYILPYKSCDTSCTRFQFFIIAIVCTRFESCKLKTWGEATLIQHSWILMVIAIQFNSTRISCLNRKCNTKQIESCSNHTETLRIHEKHTNKMNTQINK